MARKPGFLADPNQQGMILEDGAPRELTLGLTPEAVIAGTVTLPTSEAPDSITLQLFQRQVQEGRAHWVAVGASQSMSDGSFRFADLTAGTYKLLSTELLDTDPFSPTRTWTRLRRMRGDRCLDIRRFTIRMPPILHRRLRFRWARAKRKRPTFLWSSSPITA